MKVKSRSHHSQKEVAHSNAYENGQLRSNIRYGSISFTFTVFQFWPLALGLPPSIVLAATPISPNSVLHLAYKVLTAAFGTWHSTPNIHDKLNNKFSKGKKECVNSKRNQIRKWPHHKVPQHHIRGPTVPDQLSLAY